MTSKQKHKRIPGCTTNSESWHSEPIPLSPVQKSSGGVVGGNNVFARGIPAPEGFRLLW